MVLMGLLVAVSGCKKEDPDPCEQQYCLNGGVCFQGDCQCTAGYYGEHCESGNGNGELLFYQIDDANWGPATVTCAGLTGTLTQFYSSGTGMTWAVPCGAEGGVTFELAPGTYSYTVSWPNGETRGGNATVQAGQCEKVPLTVIPNTLMGRLSFYTFNPAFQNIIVTVTHSTWAPNGEVRSVTATTNGGDPANCVVSGNANYELFPTVYNYSFTINNGQYYGSGTVEVIGNQCSLVRIQ